MLMDPGAQGAPYESQSRGAPVLHILTCAGACLELTFQGTLPRASFESLAVDQGRTRRGAPPPAPAGLALHILEAQRARGETRFAVEVGVYPSLISCRAGKSPEGFYRHRASMEDSGLCHFVTFAALNVPPQRQGAIASVS